MIKLILFDSANFKTTALASNDLTNSGNPFKAPLAYDCPSSRLEHICAESIEPEKRARTDASFEDSAAEMIPLSHNTNKRIASKPEARTNSHLSMTQLDSSKGNLNLNNEVAGAKDCQNRKPRLTAQSLNRCGDDISTQSSGIINMRRAFQGMLRSDQITQGDTQTENHSLHPPVPLSVATNTPTCAATSPSKRSLAAICTKTKPLLSPTKISSLQKSKKKLRQRARVLANCSSKSKTVEKEVVFCQCGHNIEEAEIVECAYCGTWQHLHCYGYTGADDPRLPDDHACYQCLLGIEEPLSLTKLQHLAAKRRAMHFALQSGLTTQKQFAEEMGKMSLRVHDGSQLTIICIGLKLSEAAPLYNYLKNSGYVVPATGSHSAKYKATGLPSFVAVRDGPKHEEMLQELFDPLMHIAHHVCLKPAFWNSASGADHV